MFILMHNCLNYKNSVKLLNRSDALFIANVGLSINWRVNFRVHFVILINSYISAKFFTHLKLSLRDLIIFSFFRQLILNLQVRKLTMQSNQICAVCEKQPEDLLVLVCGHNLCVGCATEIYTLNGSANPFVCQICLMETQLDADTISHFQSETQRYLIKQEKKQKAHKPPKSKSPQKKMEQQKSFCRTHNQPALYYCFNCNTSQICSQCILTPKHSNHKVLTLKKAFHTLSKKLQEQIKSCQIVKSQLNQQKEFLMLKRGQCQHGYNSKKEEVKEVFDEIARMVSDKYASFCESIQQQCVKSMQIYEAYIQQINGKQKLIEDAIKLQKRAIASPSESTLVEYMSNWTDHRQILTANIPQSLPVCSIHIANASSLCYQVSSVLNKFEFGKGEQEQAIDYSVIAQQNRDEGAKAALKQSFRGVSNSSNIMSRSNNRVGSSRKLQLSRSIQNATYIINKLQQRSKNG